MPSRSTCLAFVLLCPLTSWAQDRVFTIAQVDAIYPDVEALYKDIHANPELAFQEVQTAAKLASWMKSLGYDVTTGVGRTGIVAILKNGPGPTVMLRTELDALPVDEKTGLPFASKTPHVMHACGHDLHMSAWAGTARLMVEHRVAMAWNADDDRTAGGRRWRGSGGHAQGWFVYPLPEARFRVVVAR